MQKHEVEKSASNSDLLEWQLVRLADIHRDPDNLADQSNIEGILKTALNDCSTSERDKNLFVQHFGLFGSNKGISLRKLATQYGVSVAHALHILGRGRKRLQYKLMEKGYSLEDFQIN